MRQFELNREVARLTGESVATIEQLGFLLADPGREDADLDPTQDGSHFIDWDELDAPSAGRQPRHCAATL
jgi:hypothetical protein